MKTCLKCNTKKELSEFYTCHTMINGYLNKCKECIKFDVRSNRAKNIAHYRKFDKDRSMKPHRVAARREYIQTEAGKAARRKAVVNHREKYPNEYKAKILFGNSLRSGKIIKIANCQQCGNESQEAHHDDYNHPLDVRWLCIPCHKEWHKHNTAKNRLGDFEQ